MPRPSRWIQALSAAALITGGSAVLAQVAPAAPGQAPQHEHHSPQSKQEFVQHRLDRLAQRLQITPAQQSVWQSYTRTVLASFALQTPRPDPAADAAAWARYRADSTAERARLLTQVADATAALQQALSPEQAQKFSEAMRHRHRRMHGFGGHTYKP